MQIDKKSQFRKYENSGKNHIHQNVEQRFGRKYRLFLSPWEGIIWSSETFSKNFCANGFLKVFFVLRRIFKKSVKVTPGLSLRKFFRKFWTCIAAYFQEILDIYGGIFSGNFGHIWRHILRKYLYNINVKYIRWNKYKGLANTSMYKLRRTECYKLVCGWTNFELVYTNVTNNLLNYFFFQYFFLFFLLYFYSSYWMVLIWIS